MLALPSEMEVTPPYKLHTLLTMLIMLTMLTLLTMILCL